LLISNRYQQGDQIGEGAMGVVYRGVDTHTMQPIVIKRLKPDLADAAMIERFRREGEALRQLNHPNIVKMFDAVEENDQYSLILEFVPGGNLREMMDRQPKMPLDRVLSIGIELSDALSRAHHLKIVHRDFKPANILIAEDGTPRLTDFGVITGTFAYLPPEAFAESQPTSLFDVWAFGVVLFELLTGRRSLSSSVGSGAKRRTGDIN